MHRIHPSPQARYHLISHETLFKRQTGSSYFPPGFWAFRVHRLNLLKLFLVVMRVKEKRQKLHSVFKWKLKSICKFLILLKKGTQPCKTCIIEVLAIPEFSSLFSCPAVGWSWAGFVLAGLCYETQNSAKLQSVPVRLTGSPVLNKLSCTYSL